jgi:hypothetical protein
MVNVIPNLHAIHVVGSQFSHNVFAGGAKKLQAQTRRAVKAKQNAPTNPGQPTQFPRTMSSAPPGTGPLGENAAAAGRARRQARAAGETPTTRTTQASGKTPFAGPRTSQASGAHPFAPAMPTNSPNVHLSPQFSSAETHTSPPANMFRSSETHASPKFSSVSEVPNTPTSAPKPSTNPFQVNRIENSPSAPVHTAPARSSLQFSDTSTKDNSPFPTHSHPAGSSSAILPHLTASNSTPGRPNEFTVGSRNVKGSGIGAMGSMLEQSAMEMRNRARGQ